MTHFEDELPSADPFYDLMNDQQQKVQMMLMPLSDEDLLLELRRRGRIGRINGECYVPTRYLAEGYPPERMVQEAYRQVGNALTKLHHSQGRLPGFKEETGRYGIGMGDENVKRVTVVVNYVKDRAR